MKLFLIFFYIQWKVQIEIKLKKDKSRDIYIYITISTGKNFIVHSTIVDFIVKVKKKKILLKSSWKSKDSISCSRKLTQINFQLYYNLKVHIYNSIYLFFISFYFFFSTNCTKKIARFFFFSSNFFSFGSNMQLKMRFKIFWVS